MNLIILGGWIFWILLLTSLILMVTYIEVNNKSRLQPSSFILLVTGIVFFILCKDIYFHLFYIVQTNISTVLSLIGGYFLIGSFWSFFKWRKFIKQAYKKYLIAKIKYTHITVSEYKPKVSENKEQISAWIVYFPFSVIRYLIGDLFQDFMNWIIKSFTGWYEMITDSYFKNENL